MPNPLRAADYANLALVKRDLAAGVLRPLDFGVVRKRYTEDEDEVIEIAEKELQKSATDKDHAISIWVCIMLSFSAWTRSSDSINAHAYRLVAKRGVAQLTRDARAARRDANRLQNDKNAEEGERKRAEEKAAELEKELEAKEEELGAMTERAERAEKSAAATKRVSELALVRSNKRTRAAAVSAVQSAIASVQAAASTSHAVLLRDNMSDAEIMAMSNAELEGSFDEAEKTAVADLASSAGPALLGASLSADPPHLALSS